MKVFVLALSLLTFECSSRKNSKSHSKEQFSLDGTYELRDLKTDKPGSNLSISSYNGNTFQIRGVGQSWEGTGEFINGKGYYDWTFANGLKGKTEISLVEQNKLQGRVVEKIDNEDKVIWEYIGTKLTAATSP